jgi:hypothetical protein
MTKDMMRLGHHFQESYGYKKQVMVEKPKLRMIWVR